MLCGSCGTPAHHDAAFCRVCNASLLRHSVTAPVASPSPPIVASSASVVLLPLTASISPAVHPPTDTRHASHALRHSHSQQEQTEEHRKDELEAHHAHSLSSPSSFDNLHQATATHRHSATWTHDSGSLSSSDAEQLENRAEIDEVQHSNDNHNHKKKNKPSARLSPMPSSSSPMMSTLSSLYSAATEAEREECHHDTENTISSSTSSSSSGSTSSASRPQNIPRRPRTLSEGEAMAHSVGDVQEEDRRMIIQDAMQCHHDQLRHHHDSLPATAIAYATISTSASATATRAASSTATAAATRATHANSNHQTNQVSAQGIILSSPSKSGTDSPPRVLVHGVIARSVAEKVLLECPPGTFLVRAKTSGPGLTLSVRGQKGVCHYIVENNGNNADFCLMPMSIAVPHFDSLEALLLHYAKHPIKDVCLTSTVDLFACYNEMQAARSQCAGMYSHAIEAAENLSEALELEHDILEAAKLGELADASFKDLLKRLKRIKILYCHGVPTSAWVPDTNNTTCMCCQNVRFGPLKRRHHCRNCGQLICSACVRSGQLDPSVQMEKLCKVCYGFFMRSLNKSDAQPMSATKAKRLSLTGGITRKTSDSAISESIAAST